ncbi:hypothetical protein ACQR35_04525 [Pseudarthrobacter sp. J1738]|uniref:hypothetical protein n=1 Tax=unclassified Pseudarthrobacter TaxID=2647000 RepID=UPI003D2E0518
MLTQLATTVLAAAEVAHEEPAPLLAEPWVFGICMFAVLLVMMFVTLSYTNLGNRHDVVEESEDPHRQHPNNHNEHHGH